VTEQSGPTRLLAVLRQTAEALDEHHHQWALIGGLAVSVRCEPRFTRDIDLAVAVATDAVAEGLISTLVAGGFRLRLSLEHQALGRLAAVRLIPPGESDDGVVVDLLFSSSGIETEICREADRLDIAEGVTVPVAQAGHLIATKLLAIAPDRPQDAIDLRALRTHLTARDRELARDAVAQIERLGANRSKPLLEDFERWLGSDT
jgi:predicted nucleotidyltransferase